MEQHKTLRESILLQGMQTVRGVHMRQKGVWGVRRLRKADDCRSIEVNV